MTNIDSKTKAFILNHATEDIRKLALKAALLKDIDSKQAIQQIAGRQIAKHKIPSWYQQDDIVYPPHLSMEQCSSEKTALYKQGLCIGKRLIDLTGGLGIDFSFMSRNINESIYVEKSEDLCQIAQENFETLALKNITIVNTDGVDFLTTVSERSGTIYIDPARRNLSGRKTVLIEDCIPNLIEIDTLLDEKTERSIIKLSPMLDISLSVKKLSNISEIHILSVDNECKELLLIKEKSTKPVEVHCINLHNSQTDHFLFTYSDEETAKVEYTSDILSYLYEPNSSIMKAGAYKSVANQYELKKFHPNSHLYTSDVCLSEFPGRQFKVITILPSNKKDLKKYLGNISQANISTRNYPFSVAEIRKQTKVKEGGDLFIFGTTLSNDKKVLILCEKA